MKKILAVVAILLTSLATVVSPASADVTPAGTNRCLYLEASGGVAHLRHVAGCGPRGVYHIHVWAFGTDKNVCEHTFNGTAVFCNTSIPNVIGGTQVCAELWYHLLGGGFEPYGLPCDPM